MAKYKVLTDKTNTFFTNNKITVGTAAPTTGTHKAGDIVYSSSPNATAFGWICTTSGTPGTWKVLKSGADVTSIAWSGITSKPATYTPTIGTTSTTAFRGDYGNIAYNHSKQAHAPSNAQKNSDITKAEIEAKLTGTVTSHNHTSHIMDVSVPQSGDYGYGPQGKGAGMIGVFQGWDKDCLFINTYNNNGSESPSFSRVRIKGHQANIEADTTIQQGLTVWGPLTLGHIAKVPEIQGEVKFRQDPTSDFQDPWMNTLCAIKVHGHIAATDVIKCRNFACSWMEIENKHLFMQWNDPGWGNEGAIWIRT